MFSLALPTITQPIKLIVVVAVAVALVDVLELP